MISNYYGEVMLKRVSKQRAVIMRAVKDAFLDEYSRPMKNIEKWVMSIDRVSKMCYDEVQDQYKLVTENPNHAKTLLVEE